MRAGKYWMIKRLSISKAIISKAVVVSAALLASSAANAALYDFSFRSNVFDITGTFDTQGPANSNGTFNIVDASGTVTLVGSTNPLASFTLVSGNGEQLLEANGTEYYSNWYDPVLNRFASNGLLVTGNYQGTASFVSLYNGAAANYPSCTADCASVTPGFSGTSFYDPGVT